MTTEGLFCLSFPLEASHLPDYSSLFYFPIDNLYFNIISLPFYGNYKAIDIILLCSLFVLLHTPEDILGSQMKMTAVVSYVEERKW